MNRQQTRLFFGFGNAKLSKNIVTFSLPAGWTCPGAKFCFARTKKDGGGLINKNNPLIEKKEKNKVFRCYAASEENVYSNVRKSRWKNFEVLKGKTKEQIIEILKRDIPKYTRILRIHPSGDFFSQNYFDAWLEIVRQNPQITFYAYTKSLPFWQKRAKTVPANFVLTASYGGKYDHLIAKNKLKNATVVFSTKHKNIDFDDGLAINPKVKKFNLLIHGTQPAGTPAAQAWQRIKTTIGGYSK